MNRIQLKILEDAFGLISKLDRFEVRFVHDLSDRHTMDPHLLLTNPQNSALNRLGSKVTRLLGSQKSSIAHHKTVDNYNRRMDTRPAAGAQLLDDIQDMPEED